MQSAVVGCKAIATRLKLSKSSQGKVHHVRIYTYVVAALLCVCFCFEFRIMRIGV